MKAHPGIRLTFGLIALFLTLHSAFAQNNYVSHSFNDTSLILSTSSNTYSVAFTTSEIVKIGFKPGTVQAHNTSYSVVLDQAIPCNLDEDGSSLSLSVSGLEVEIQKNPVTISFKKTDGTVLIAESESLNSSSGIITASFNIKPDENFYGGGSRAIPVSRNGYDLAMYNAPWYGYEYEASNLNIGIPFVVSSENYGLFFDKQHPGNMQVDMDGNNLLNYSVYKDDELSYYFISGGTFDRVMDNYTNLTGKQPLPPRWALGFIQSKFGYETEAEARDIIDGLRNDQFPVDAIVLDLQWQGGVFDMGDLDWDRSRFPEAETMMSDFQSLGVKTILIFDPYFLSTTNNFTYLEAMGFLAEDPQGNSYELNNFWAGNAGLLDITLPAAQEWLWTKYNQKIQEGVTGFWSDLGEPELHPSDMVHSTGNAEDIHNVYSLIWGEMLYRKMMQNYPDTRLFNLIRSGFAGMQRYSTFPWSGDIQRSYRGLYAQTPIQTGMGLSGVAYMHSDLGGFTGGGENPELYTRWIQFGAFSPVMRAHGTGIDMEPNNYPEPYKSICRRYIQLRYSMLPYNYSLAWLNTTTGRPLMMPLNYFEPDNALTKSVNDQFFWGKDILVAPVLEEGAVSRDVIFPAGEWIDNFTGKVYQGNTSASIALTLGEIPYFYRAGALIPKSEVQLSTDFFTPEAYSIHYYPTANAGKTQFTIFEDDGKTKSNLESNQFTLIDLDAEATSSDLLLKVTNRGPGSTDQPDSCLIEFIVHNNVKSPESVSVNDELITLASNNSEYMLAGQGAYWNADSALLKVKTTLSSDSVQIVISDIEYSTAMQDILDETIAGLNVYPTQISNGFKVEYTNKKGGIVTITLTDMMGRKIETQIIQSVIPGTIESTLFNTNSLNAGIYFLSVSANNSAPITRRLIKY
ncbi:MAG: DUF4968 domain-containing protein [Bacteroidota bacterium]|nr:MAG: DUF4968 domain-containing protein [Bacteroidota bacterium]